MHRFPQNPAPLASTKVVEGQPDAYEQARLKHEARKPFRNHAHEIRHLLAQRDAR